MNIKELREAIKDLPEDMEVYYEIISPRLFEESPHLFECTSIINWEIREIDNKETFVFYDPLDWR